jgi:hypothetical protein
MTIAPIETVYRGYRFRSRLEARWAVFLDAAGIKWQYEPEGFNVNGRNYLPDFLLPELETFVEVKPTFEAAEQLGPTLLALAKQSNRRAVFVVGSPNTENPPEIHAPIDAINFSHPRWYQCAFCGHVFMTGRVLSTHTCEAHGLIVPRLAYSPRLTHALIQAQRARFEYGEDGRPDAMPSTATRVRVYLAGPVLDHRVVEGTVFETITLPWRGDIFGKEIFVETHGNSPFTYGRIGRFTYGGPTILAEHGTACDIDLAGQCLGEVQRSDALFCWLDRCDTVGTFIELGFARAWRKPIFVAFADPALTSDLYFARDVADAAVCTASVLDAWRMFTCWRDLIDAPMPEVRQ